MSRRIERSHSIRINNNVNYHNSIMIEILEVFAKKKVCVSLREREFASQLYTLFVFISAKDADESAQVNEMLK